MTTSEDTYYFVPGLRSLDPLAREIDLKSHTWVRAMEIDDTDLTYEGKSLSSWFEDERSRRSSHSSHSSNDENDEEDK
ncbi:uncharacterized protein MAM_06447 [Metarhizium album ARSEF 1941]|uniref:Uncharacterized protein n=1 Tax=Metarhizium album (strain ARSEF 1941) TaxID=1081103 RepID=A0A0B2WHV1_METAS|nr:uncharacterized protein MAM_06447 [Metarhizium album ARSEF 1941]KHN95606.1 hypothetical protein MAM_06447 [Metarhizium album ARSEF 1941]